MQNAVPAYGNRVEQGGILGDIFSLPFLAADQIRDFADALTQLTTMEMAPAVVNEETLDFTPPTPAFR